MEFLDVGVEFLGHLPRCGFDDDMIAGEKARSKDPLMAVAYFGSDRLT